MTTDEIAGSLEISKRTVDRKLCLIRAVWEEEPTCTPR
jgi:ECF sigma factor